MKLRAGIISGLMLLGLAVSPAFAADKGGPRLEDPASFADAASPWTRLYASVSGAYGMQNTEVSGLLLGNGTVSEGDFAYGLGAGGSFRVPNTQLVVGAECNYSWVNADGVNKMWDCLGKLGVLFSPTTQVYAAGGITSLNGSIPSSLDSGMTFGGGVETFVTKNFSLKAEYLYVDLGSAQDVPMPGPNPDLASALHVVRIGGNIKLNGLFGN